MSMKFRNPALVLLAASLAACGGSGGGGGVASTPPPGGSGGYQTLAELQGDQRFTTAGVSYRGTPTTLENRRSYNMGTGPILSYDVSQDTFTVSVSADTETTFFPGDLVDQGPNYTSFRRGGDTLTIIQPSVGGVPLSYTQFGSYFNVSSPTQPGNEYLLVGGVPTTSNDLPTSGTANYTLSAEGIVRADGTGSRIVDEPSNGSMAVNFGTNQIAFDFAMRTGSFDFGTAEGSAALRSSDASFTGTITSGRGSGQIGGAFFGPQAEEVGFAWQMTGADFFALGFVAGKKD